MCLFINIGVPFPCKISCMHLFSLGLLLYCISPGIFCSGSIFCKCVWFAWVWPVLVYFVPGLFSVSVYDLHGSGPDSTLWYNFPKERDTHRSEMTLNLLSFKLSFLHIVLCTLYSGLYPLCHSLQLKCHLWHQIHLNISYIFHLTVVLHLDSFEWQCCVSVPTKLPFRCHQV